MPKKRRQANVNATGRNKHEQYMIVPYVMVRSPAWRNLSGPALKVLFELRARFNGSNNGELFLSLDEAARILHIGKTTAMRAYKELEQKGFIRMMERGQWYGRKATKYAITEKPLEGKPATQDWKNWKPKKTNPRS